MDINCGLAALITVLDLVILIGFFITKEKGYGRFNTSVLLLLTVTAFVPLLLVLGKIESRDATNLFFAVIGFAGGLFTAKLKPDSTSPTKG